MQIDLSGEWLHGLECHPVDKFVHDVVEGVLDWLDFKPFFDILRMLLRKTPQGQQKLLPLRIIHHPRQLELQLLS